VEDREKGKGGGRYEGGRGRGESGQYGARRAAGKEGGVASLLPLLGGQEISRGGKDGGIGRVHPFSQKRYLFSAWGLKEKGVLDEPSGNNLAYGENIF